MPYALTFDETRLWFEVRGSQGVPILLIAGNACDHHVWDDVVEVFAKNHRVVVYDHRGTGKSDNDFPAAWTTRDFARDAAMVLDAAGFERVHVYGHSMGGRVAQWLGIDFPSRVGTLVLGATSPGEKYGVPRPVQATAAMMSNDPTALERMCYPDGWAELHQDTVAAAKPNPGTKEAFLAHLRASTSHDVWEALTKISAPTLVIHGSEDEITLAANGELLAQRIPGARLWMVDGARHVYWAGRPEVQDTVLKFFDDAA